MLRDHGSSSALSSQLPFTFRRPAYRIDVTIALFRVQSEVHPCLELDNLAVTGMRVQHLIHARVSCGV